MSHKHKHQRLLSFCSPNHGSFQTKTEAYTRLVSRFLCNSKDNMTLYCLQRLLCLVLRILQILQATTFFFIHLYFKMLQNVMLSREKDKEKRKQLLLDLHPSLDMFFWLSHCLLYTLLLIVMFVVFCFDSLRGTSKYLGSLGLLSCHWRPGVVLRLLDHFFSF